MDHIEPWDWFAALVAGWAFAAGFLFGNLYRLRRFRRTFDESAVREAAFAAPLKKRAARDSVPLN